MEKNQYTSTKYQLNSKLQYSSDKKNLKFQHAAQAPALRVTTPV
jgi:hypothetical protein